MKFLVLTGHESVCIHQLASAGTELMTFISSTPPLLQGYFHLDPRRKNLSNWKYIVKSLRDKDSFRCDS